MKIHILYTHVVDPHYPHKYTMCFPLWCFTLLIPTECLHKCLLSVTVFVKHCKGKQMLVSWMLRINNVKQCKDTNMKADVCVDVGDQQSWYETPKWEADTCGRWDQQLMLTCLHTSIHVSVSTFSWQSIPWQTLTLSFDGRSTNSSGQD